MTMDTGGRLGASEFILSTEYSVHLAWGGRELNSVLSTVFWDQGKGAEPPFETVDERGGTAMNLTD